MGYAMLTEKKESIKEEIRYLLIGMGATLFFGVGVIFLGRENLPLLQTDSSVRILLAFIIGGLILVFIGSLIPIKNIFFHKQS